VFTTLFFCPQSIYANTYFGNLSNCLNNYLSATKPVAAKEDNRIPDEKPMNRTKPTQSTLRTDSSQSITKSDLSKNSSQPGRPESGSYSGEDSTHSTVYVLVIVDVLSIVGLIIGSVIFGIVRKRKTKKGINEQNVDESNNKKAKEVSDESDNNKDKTNKKKRLCLALSLMKNNKLKLI
jgi:hypothetical protein